MPLLEQVVSEFTFAIVVVFGILFLLASFDLFKWIVRGLQAVGELRLSLARGLGWTLICAVWMALTRSEVPLLVFGLLALLLFGLVQAGIRRQPGTASQAEPTPVPSHSRNADQD